MPGIRVFAPEDVDGFGILTAGNGATDIDLLIADEVPGALPVLTAAC